MAHLVAKISDLGVAKAVKFDGKLTMTKVPGTSDFMLPEALEDSSKYGPPLDIFSYGGVALFMISQERPVLLPVKRFDQTLNRSVFLTEVERRQRYVDKMIGNAEEIKPLVLSCLDENPIVRQAAAEVLENVKQFKCHCQDQEEQNQQAQQHLIQQQQQLMTAQMKFNIPSSELVNQKQSEESFHDGSIASYLLCKSDGCSSEMTQDGYCLRCCVTNQPPTQVRTYIAVLNHVWLATYIMLKWPYFLAFIDHVYRMWTLVCIVGYFHYHKCPIVPLFIEKLQVKVGFDLGIERLCHYFSLLHSKI